jgi:hypothetical protein
MKISGGIKTSVALVIAKMILRQPLQRSLLKFRHPERSECEAFAQSKDPAHLPLMIKGGQGSVAKGHFAALPWT